MPYDEKPPKLTLVNLATGKSLETQFLPEELEEATGTNFAKLTVPGLSHQRKHFINTDDCRYTFTMYNHCIGKGAAALKSLLDARGFLKAACHPRRNTGESDRDGPPRLLLVWPNFISVQVRLMSPLTFKFSKFNKFGTPIAYAASVVMEEQRDAFVGMEDILADMDADSLDDDGGA